jgi:hypothetical protein
MTIKSFDQILQEIITDYNSMAPERDTSQGSDTFIDAACQAAALWGIYKYVDYVKRQISPLTCDSNFLSMHASTYGVDRIAGESDSDLLARLLLRLRKPPAGGNKYDYESWTRAVAFTHTAAWQANAGYNQYDVVIGGSSGFLYICKTAGTSGSSAPTWTTDPGDEVSDNTITWQVWEAESFFEFADRVFLFLHTRGMGSIDIVVVSNYVQSESGNALFNGIPSNAFLVEILSQIEDKGPVCAYDYRVLAPVNKSTTVTVTVPSGETTSAQRNKIKTDIIAHILGLNVGQKLYVVNLIAICVNNDVPNYVSIVPASDVPCLPDINSPSTYERIWPYDANGDETVTVVEG